MSTRMTRMWVEMAFLTCSDHEVKLGYFAYGDAEEELKCYWNDPSEEVYATFETKSNFLFGDDSIMQSVRFHYDHKDFDRDMRLVADENHVSKFACKFEKTSAESVAIIDELNEVIRKEQELSVAKVEEESKKYWAKRKAESDKQLKEFEEQAAEFQRQAEEVKREQERVIEDMIKRADAQRLRMLQIGKELGVGLSGIYEWSRRDLLAIKPINNCVLHFIVCFLSETSQAIDSRIFCKPSLAEFWEDCVLLLSDETYREGHDPILTLYSWYICSNYNMLFD